MAPGSDEVGYAKAAKRLAMNVAFRIKLRSGRGVGNQIFWMMAMLPAAVIPRNTVCRNSKNSAVVQPPACKSTHPHATN